MSIADEELRAFMVDVIAELRELRRLVERPTAVDHAARLFLALANILNADDTYFEREEPLEWARDNAELSAALEALGLHDPADLGYWLRGRKGHESAGYRIVREGRGWRMEACR
jgi:hypothetical protein